jgi:hypothetical protein
MKVKIDVGPHKMLNHCLFYDKQRNALYYKHRKKRNDNGKLVDRIMQYYPVSEMPKDKRKKLEKWLKEQST